MNNQIEIKYCYRIYSFASLVKQDKVELTKEDFSNETSFTFKLTKESSQIREIVFPKGLKTLKVDDNVNEADWKIEVIHLPYTVSLSPVFRELTKIKSLLILIINPIEKIKSRIHELSYTIASLNSIDYPNSYVDSGESDFDHGIYVYADNDVSTYTDFKKENLLLVNDGYYYLKDNNQYELMKIRNKQDVIVEEYINNIKVTSIDPGAFDKFHGKVIHIPASIESHTNLTLLYNDINLDFYNGNNYIPNDRTKDNEWNNKSLIIYERMKQEGSIDCSFDDYLIGNYNYIIKKGIKDYEIEVIKEKVRIKKCNLNDEIIILPKMINNYVVTSLGEKSFYKHINLRRLIMHDEIKEILKGAFVSCIALDFIKFSKSLEYIAPKSFYKCISLNEFYIPSNLVNRDFYECVENYDLKHDKEVIKQYEDGFVTRVKTSFCFYRGKQSDYYVAPDIEMIEGGQYDFETVIFHYDYKLDYHEKNIKLSKEGYYYFLNGNNEAILTHGSRYYNFGNNNVVLPDTLDGYLLVAIGNFAFENAIFINMNFPDSLKEIGICAFKDAIFNSILINEDNVKMDSRTGIESYHKFIGDNLSSDLESEFNKKNYQNNLKEIINISKDNSRIIYYDKNNGCSYKVKDNKAIIINIDHDINIEDLPSDFNNIEVEGITWDVLGKRIINERPFTIPTFITKLLNYNDFGYINMKIEDVVLPPNLKVLDLNLGCENSYFIIPKDLKELNIGYIDYLLVIPNKSKVKINSDEDEIEIIKGFERVIYKDGINYFLCIKNNKKVAFAYSTEYDYDTFRFVDEIEGYKVVGADLSIEGKNFIFDYLGFDGSNTINLSCYNKYDDDWLEDEMAIEKKQSRNYFTSFNFNLSISDNYIISSRVKKINNIRNYLWPILNEGYHEYDFEKDNECTIVLEEGIEEIDDFYSNEITYKDHYKEEYVTSEKDKKKIILPKSLKRVGKDALRYCNIGYILAYDSTIIDNNSIDKWCVINRRNDNGYIKNENRKEYVKKCLSIFSVGSEGKSIIDKIYNHIIPEVHPYVIQKANDIFNNWGFESICIQSDNIHAKIKSIDGETRDIMIYNQNEKLHFSCGCRYCTGYGCAHTLALVLFVKEYYKEILYWSNHFEKYRRY